MLEALVIMLREGLEAALVVGIVFAYLARTGRGELRRYVWLGLGAAVVASVGGAVLFQWLGINPDNEIYEGTIMLVAAAFTTTMVVWMWRTGRTLRAELEEKMGRVLNASDVASARRAGWGLAAFTFVTVFREGIEAVLFLTALSATIGTNPLNNLIGGTLGLALAALFGTLLAKGALRVNLGRFFSVTSFVLLILVAKLVANGVHEFLEKGWLPSTPELLTIIGLLTRETTSLVILMALIAAPALLILWDAWRTPLLAPLEEESGPERRKRMARALRARHWATAASLSALLITAMLGSSLVAAAAFDAEMPITEMQAHDDMIHIPVADVDDGQMHKYMYRHDGIGVRFFLIRRSDGSLATALDACGICPPKGYRRVGNQVMCRNCDAPINLDTIGEPGGCNPVPLTATVQGQDVVITVADLAANEGKFKGQ
jgi:high-affinity iron transporter